MHRISLFHENEVSQTKLMVLLCLLGGIQNFLSAVALRGVSVLPAEVLRHLPGRELGLTDVAKVPRQVDGLPLHQARQ